jgi:hypothetical protein
MVTNASQCLVGDAAAYRSAPQAWTVVEGERIAVRAGLVTGIEETVRNASIA